MITFHLQAPHPYYIPSNNLVDWKDPICQSLHTSGDKRRENPGQCDYEVKYADGGSSLGVLVKDAFNLNFTSENHQSPLLALGLFSLLSFFIKTLRDSMHFSFGRQACII